MSSTMSLPTSLREVPKVLLDALDLEASIMFRQKGGGVSNVIRHVDKSFLKDHPSLVTLGVYHPDDRETFVLAIYPSLDAANASRRNIIENLDRGKRKKLMDFRHPRHLDLWTKLFQHLDSRLTASDQDWARDFRVPLDDDHHHQEIPL